MLQMKVRPAVHDIDVYPIPCVVGILLNLVCLIVFIRRRSHPNVPTLIALSVYDSLILVLSLFVQREYTKTNKITSTLGHIVVLVMTASERASVWTVCFNTVQRYRATVKPFSTPNSVTKGVPPFIVIGILAMLCLLPVVLVGASYQRSIDPKSLAMYHKNILFCAADVVPFILILLLNRQILFCISVKEMNAQPVDDQRKAARKRRFVWLIFAFVINYVISHIGLLFDSVHFDTRGLSDSRLFRFENAVYLLGHLNSITNPLFYFFFTVGFIDLRRDSISPTRKNAALQQEIEML